VAAFTSLAATALLVAFFEMVWLQKTKLLQDM
jgi:hypothetical protein